MKLLFDTHAFIWWDSAPQQLSVAAREAIEDPRNDLLLSSVSIWEIVIKHQLGKLSIARPLAKIVEEQTAQGIRMLELRCEHALLVGRLPQLHKDPFDRALVAQAISEGAALVTQDQAVTGYPVQIVW